MPTLALGPDGTSIVLNVNPKVTEFLGYNDTSTLFDNLRGKPHWPLPKFRIRESTTGGFLTDGQTLILAGFTDQMFSKMPDGSIVKSYYLEKKKQLLVFITATLVDSTGNVVHGLRKAP